MISSSCGFDRGTACSETQVGSGARLSRRNSTSKVRCSSIPENHSCSTLGRSSQWTACSHPRPLARLRLIPVISTQRRLTNTHSPERSASRITCGMISVRWRKCDLEASTCDEASSEIRRTSFSSASAFRFIRLDSSVVRQRRMHTAIDRTAATRAVEGARTPSPGTREAEARTPATAARKSAAGRSFQSLRITERTAVTTADPMRIAEERRKGQVIQKAGREWRLSSWGRASLVRLHSTRRAHHVPHPSRGSAIGGSEQQRVRATPCCVDGGGRPGSVSSGESTGR